MSKTFRAWKIDEPLLLPVTVQEFVPKDHLARFLLSVVEEEVDLGEIMSCYSGPKGQPPFHPTMMTTLLLYGYCSGVYSSRRIAKACGERVDFMSLVGLDAPDFRTIAEFRRRHLSALKGLFVQVLSLCDKAGLTKLGHVAFDGSKIRANASKHKAMSYGRMEARASELDAEVAEWLAAAEAADAAEDKLHGRDKRGDELPAWAADKKQRAAKIRAAKAELEAEAKAAAEAKAKAAAEAEEKRRAEGRKKPGPPAAPPSPEPDPKAQKNFTDPESRIMKSKDGFVQAYNGQIAVDAQAQVIVAHDVTQSPVDSGQLLPMADAVEANLGRKPAAASADCGYCSEANLAGLEERKIDAYVATGRAKDAVAGAAPEAATDGTAAAVADAAAAMGPAQAAKAPTRVEAMRAKIKSGGHASPYRLRKQVVEPVFGQIKQARGFRQFLLRGVEKVRCEWALVCTAHNLLKLAQGRSLSAARPMPQTAGLAVA
jgi:transposase